ncbi:MAG TPA: hypothetical protein VGF94_08115 [Kofleriaceae bacterium]|jgi:hypothetical protein
MIGARIGKRIGAVVGKRIGVGADELGGGSSNPLAGVTRDAASGIYCPANATEWAAVLAVAAIASGGPSNLYLMQDASGALADAIGSAPMTAAGTASYQQTKSGWSRFAITSADASTVKFSTTALPDPATSSCLVIGYMFFPSIPASTRNPIVVGTVTSSSMRITATSKVLAVSSGNQVTSASTYMDGAVRALAFRYNVTAGSLVVFTDSEKLSPTFVAASGQLLDLFSSGTAGAEGWLYAAVFTGSAAELSDAQLKTLEHTLGFSPTWS